MTEIVCPGWPASWINAWLAAVGASVLDERIRLSWTTDAEPQAVLSSEAVDPLEVLAAAWPNAEFLSDLPIAQDWRDAGRLQRKVSVEAWVERARAARSHEHAWTLSSTMTDLCVDGQGEVQHARFDPAGPGTIKWLHHRLVKVHGHVDCPLARLRESLAGQADRVKDNGLGFDQTRLGSLHDATDPWVDPVVEVLAFFGQAILPVRGRGADGRFARSAVIRVRQKGWRQPPESSESTRFNSLNLLSRLPGPRWRSWSTG